MVTTITNQSALPTRRLEGKTVSPRFAGGTESLLKPLKPQVEQEAVVRGYRLASFLKDKLFGAKLFNIDVRKGGLSLEDVAGRLQTLVGIYLLQGYYAVKDDKHPWETNGRNAMIWVMTLLLQNLTKSENYGINTVLFNPLMRQKGYLSSEKPWLQKALDKTRMDVDYVDILQDAGISINKDELKGARTGKKALWASSWLDANKADLIKKRYQDLEEKVQKKLPMTAEESKIHKAIPKFFKRINGWNGASTAIIMGVTIYFIGGVAMRIVNKLISPLDKDFDGNKRKQPGRPNLPISGKGHPPQNTSQSTAPASSSPHVDPNSTANSSIQFFQSYVSHRRQSSPTLPGGLY